MDNTNQNSPINPNPVQPEPTPTPVQPPFPPPVPSWPPVPQPASEPDPIPMAPSPWSQDTTQTTPVSAWTPPISTQTEPAQAPAQPEPDLPLAEPTPTFTPPITNPTNEPSTNSPLDNPWGTTPATPTQPSWMVDAQNTNTPPIPTETAPTDLSHLISNNQQEPAPTPITDSLVVPTPGANPEVPNLQTESHKGIPKWLIGLGIGLLILVVGASAYFILGVGQPSKPTTSIPAVTQTPAPTAIPTSQPTVAPVATGSANFGEVSGSTQQQATGSSAMETLLRQRQQGK